MATVVEYRFPESFSWACSAVHASQCFISGHFFSRLFTQKKSTNTIHCFFLFYLTQQETINVDRRDLKIQLRKNNWTSWSTRTKRKGYQHHGLDCFFFLRPILLLSLLQYHAIYNLRNNSADRTLDSWPIQYNSIWTNIRWRTGTRLRQSHWNIYILRMREHSTHTCDLAIMQDGRYIFSGSIESDQRYLYEIPEYKKISVFYVLHIFLVFLYNSKIIFSYIYVYFT